MSAVGRTATSKPRGLAAGTLIELERDDMNETPPKGLFDNVPGMDEIAARTNEELRQKLLTREDITSGHIDIGDIPAVEPGGGSSSAYPYDKWAEIPPGKAVEITLLLRNRRPWGVRASLSKHFRRHNMGLHVIQRQEGGRWRMWVARPREKENVP